MIEVATIEDQEGDEADETFRVELSGASGAILGDGAGTGTIIDDDGGTSTEDTPIEVSIADATVEEGGTAKLAVTLSRASQGAVTVSYRTMDGTARAGSDYTAILGTLAFKVGSRREVVRSQDAGGQPGGARRDIHGGIELSEWRDAARLHRYGHDP